jgi:hypothetical protein
MSERRVSPRHAIVLPALCQVRDRAEFHAVSVDISADGLRLRSATIPPSGTRLDCNIRGVGAMEVSVAWAGTCDFAVRVTGRDPSPGEVARRLIALSQKQAKQSDEVRVHRRIVPARTAVRVALADGTAVPATILNLSASGVALRIDVPLAVGQEIVVGQRRAMVARQIAQGVGAVFAEPLDDAAVGENTVL